MINQMSCDPLATTCPLDSSQPAVQTPLGLARKVLTYRPSYFVGVFKRNRLKDFFQRGFGLARVRPELLVFVRTSDG